jgi:hypothetical protein
VPELDGVGVEECFGYCIGDPEAAVVLEGWANVVTVAATEVPGFACARLIVDDDWASEGAEGCGIEVERAVEVFPS